jgi:hypothetical protein
MRALVIALAMMLLALPASAQSGMSALGKRPTQSSYQKDTGPPKIKADEKAYKAALEKIPNQQPKASDPWGNVRAPEPVKGQK